MRTKKFIPLSACFAAMLAIPQIGLAQDAPDLNIDFDQVVAIIGGQDSQRGNFPSTTALLRVSPTQNLFQRQFCAGTAISDSHILTAAHCMFGAFGEIGPDELLVAGNFIDLLSDSPAEIPVSDIFVHESYDDTALLAEHDIAVLRTSVPHNIPPITLFNGDVRSLTGVNAWIAGWGVSRLPQFPGDTSRFPSTLNEAKVPVTDFNICNEVYDRKLSAPHVCAGFAEGGVDSCQGDSGGPLMINDGGRLLQIGVTSFGRGCALPDAYGVYSNVDLYKSFVSRIVPPPSNGNRLFDAPRQSTVTASSGGDGAGGNDVTSVDDVSSVDDDDDSGSTGLGSTHLGMLLLLALGGVVRARPTRLITVRLAGVAAAAIFTTGCVTDLPSSNDDRSTEQSGSFVVANNDSNQIKTSTKVSNKVVSGASLVRTSSDHKDLPMFDVAALSEKRQSAMEAATARYGVEPVCEGKKVAPKNSKRADFYERCEFVGMAKAFEGGTIESVTYHFMSNRIVQIDATLHGPAFVMAPISDALEDILGDLEFSVGKTEASDGGEAMPQAVYNWSEPSIAYARLMTEAGADTESFLLTLQHPSFTDVITELAAL